MEEGKSWNASNPFTECCRSGPSSAITNLELGQLATWSKCPTISNMSSDLSRINDFCHATNRELSQLSSLCQMQYLWQTVSKS